jgi:hypothetical protein
MTLTNKRELVRGIVMTLLINGILPLVIYDALLGHLSNVLALSLATCIPLFDNVVHFMKNRRLDVFAALMLVGFLLSLAAVFLGGSERLILIRESFVTGLIGLIFFGSLFFPRPLIYYFALRFTVGNEHTQTSAFVSNWQYPYFRFALRFLTIIWGVALVGEAIVRSILVFQLSIPQFLAISSIITYGFIGAAILFTIYYRRHSKKRLEKIKAFIRVQDGTVKKRGIYT